MSVHYLPKKQNEMYLSKSIMLKKVLRAIKNSFNMCHVLQTFKTHKRNVKAKILHFNSFIKEFYQ